MNLTIASNERLLKRKIVLERFETGALLGALLIIVGIALKSMFCAMIGAAFFLLAKYLESSRLRVEQELRQRRRAEDLNRILALVGDRPEATAAIVQFAREYAWK